MAWLAFLMMLVVFAALLSGYPVGFVLGGVSLIFAGIGILTGTFDPAYLSALPNRLYGFMLNQFLLTVPLFVFMGVVLERSKIAENLLATMSLLFGPIRGGMAISVAFVGMLMAASTGIVGATVITMGLLSLPIMLQRGYQPALASGTICAAGTLGQIIPPSIVLILLGDVLSSAYQQAQLNSGNFSPDTVSIGDLFAGAFIPGLLLVACYILYILVLAWLKPDYAPAVPASDANELNYTFFVRIIKAVAPPLILITAVLGSIFFGVATATEAAAVGAMGALLLSMLYKQFSFSMLQDVMRSTLNVSCMVFMILIGAAFFSLVFRGYGGEAAIQEFLTQLPGGRVAALVLVMLVLFLLGFVLDFIEIIFIVVPIVGPILLSLDIDPVWLGVMLAINLQTSFLTPPFGFALFYLRGVAPDSVSTVQIYRGVVPFIIIQVLVLMLLALWPNLATWLPNYIYAN